MSKDLTVMYARPFVAGGELRTNFRHVGHAFQVKGGGQPGEVDIHLWELPPWETHSTQLPSGIWVNEYRMRLMVREKRDRNEPEVSKRRAFGGER